MGPTLAAGKVASAVKGFNDAGLLVARSGVAEGVGNRPFEAGDWKSDMVVFMGVWRGSCRSHVTLVIECCGR